MLQNTLLKPAQIYFSKKQIFKCFLLILILIFFFPIFNFSQKKAVEWGKIPRADLAMQVYKKDSTADAIVLANTAKVSVESFSSSYRTRTARHRRIKILKEAGFEYGDVEIPFYSHDNTVGMGRVYAQIFNPDGSKYELGKKEIFEEQYNEYWSVVKFAFPNIQEGSVIEWKYETLSKNVHLLPTWYFQESIPVRYNELKFYYPDNFAYTYLFEGNAGMTKREEDGATILEGEAGNIWVKNDKFIMTNAVAMKEEPYITTMEDYKARVRFQLDSYINYEGQLIKELSSWEEVTKELYHQWSFGGQYNKKKFVKKLLETLKPELDKCQTETEKAKFIYNYIADNFTWDGSFWWRVEKNLDKIIEEKQGNSGELNLLQLAMLKAIGIDAQPLLISTRSNGKMYEKYPMLHQFNHVLVHAQLDGKTMNLDIPDRNRPMDLPMVSSLHGRGVVISNAAADWVNVAYPVGSDTFAYELELDETGTLTGKLQCVFKGYNALPEKRHYRKNQEGAHWVDRFSKNYPETKIGEVSFKNLEEPEKNFTDELKIKIPEAAQVVGDFIYFSPVLYSNFSKNMFKLEKRYFPIDFSYPFRERVFAKVTIPEGYEIEELPKSANFGLPNNGGSFRFVIEKTAENQLQIVVNLNIQQIRFNPLEYPSIRELFDLVEEKMGEQIVLKKKS